MSERYEYIKNIQVPINTLYPLVTIDSIDPEVLNEAVSKERVENRDKEIIVAEYEGDLYVVKGIYEVLAAGILGKQYINVDVFDFHMLPGIKGEEDIKNRIGAISLSKLYDFETVGGFRYEKYPVYYERR